MNHRFSNCLFGWRGALCVLGSCDIQTEKPGERAEPFWRRARLPRLAHRGGRALDIWDVGGAHPQASEMNWAEDGISQNQSSPAHFPSRSFSPEPRTAVPAP